ncbi:MAG: HAD-IA family hydrolase, partial [Pseudomonadales bacterium]|nr:HAD-IA family hydrolase [Pseudomonadales bacterium]
MPVSIISLDLDNTLWHAEPTLIAAEKAMLGWLQEFSPDVLVRARERGWSHYRKQTLAENPDLVHRVSELRLKALQLLMLDCGLSQEASKQAAQGAFDCFWSARQNVSLFPETRTVLDQLKREFSLISITNGNADVEHIGLNDYFTYSLRAEEIGIGKPDPAIFQHALAQINAQPESCIHVGDHIIDDIQGAAESGIKTIWFNWQNQSQNV